MAAKKRTVEEYYGEIPKTLDNQPFYGMTLDEEQLNFANMIINPDIDIIFVKSKAGTSKTTIKTRASNLLVKYGNIDNII